MGIVIDGAGSRPERPESRPPLERMSAEWLGGRREIDVEELISLADYVAPANGDRRSLERRRRDAAIVLVEWADGDRALLRRAWRMAVLRARSGEIRHAAAELLSDASPAPPSGLGPMVRDRRSEPGPCGGTAGSTPTRTAVDDGGDEESP